MLEEFVRGYRCPCNNKRDTSFAPDLVRDTDDGPIRLEASTANARMLLGPQDNGYGTTWQVWVRFAPEHTATLPAGFIGVYDLELTRPDGFRQTYRKGRFKVEGDVTRSEP